MKIEEVAKIDRLRSVRGWCCGIGIALILIVITMFPLATRNPGTMATSAIAAFSEVGSMAWMAIPIAALGAPLAHECNFHNMENKKAFMT